MWELGRCQFVVLILVCFLHVAFAQTKGGCDSSCVDVDPAGDFGCTVQAEWGKCDEDWMKTCDCACGRCPKLSSEQTPMKEEKEAEGKGKQGRDVAPTVSPSSGVVFVTQREQSGFVGDESGLIGTGDFVQRAGTRFVVKSRSDPSECGTFYFVGWNTYYPMMRSSQKELRYEIDEILDDAVSMGLSVVRVWGFSDGPLQWQGAQRFPGFYDEATLVGMDYFIHEASKRGIRVVLAFANYWQHYGGIDQYNIWSYQAGFGKCNGEYACRDDFFTDAKATEFYKNHVAMFLNRVNTFNGRVYKEDPAIFGFNLMNEPRSKYDLYVVTRESTDTAIGEYNITYNNGDSLHSWIEDVVGFIKDIDPVHLLTTGMEGFFGESAPLYLYANPGAWAALEGNDFVRNHQVKGIDYATMHVYIDQWLCDLRGATREGQMEFFQKWVEAHQEAAEEELQMPVILEEFGGKLEDNKRYDIYKFAFESQLASARRGGSFGGVMFWILYHSDYSAMDHYGGGYGMYYPAESSAEQAVHDLVTAQSSALLEINAGSEGQGTCVWYPPWPQGLGCRHLSIEFELGGMPWECLPGEAENINWCNSRGRLDLYRNPPEEWKGRKDGKDLPFNTVESLIMGKIINRSTQKINLGGSYIIVPFSRGIHTIFEGVWERVEDPNVRFGIYCWYATVIEADGVPKSGSSLCQDGSLSFEITEFGWPIGVKRDRGLKINFISDIVLNPGAYIAGNADGSSVIVSFKDEFLHNRLDVSSLALAGANDCPSGPRLTSWPPPPPPPPPACSVGKHPYRGCPQLEWYTPGESVNFITPDPIPEPCEFEDCPEGTFNPYKGPRKTDTVVAMSLKQDDGNLYQPYKPTINAQQLIGSIDSLVSGLSSNGSLTIPQQTQSITVVSQGRQSLENAQNVVSAIASLMGVPPRSIMKNPTAFAAGLRAIEYLSPGIIERLGYFSSNSQSRTFNNATVQPSSNTGRKLQQSELGISSFASLSNEFDGFEVGFKPGALLAFTASIKATGSYRDGSYTGVRALRIFDDSEIDLTALSQGLLVREDEPESVSKEDLGPTAADTPNPEARGAASRGGLTALVVAEMTLDGLSGKKYRTIAKGVVIPNGRTETVRGIIQLDEDVQSMKIYAEIGVAGLSVSLSDISVFFPTELPSDEADQYSPCIIDPDHSPDAIMVFAAEQTEDWSVEICSRGYSQSLRIYEDGEEKAHFGHGFGYWKLDEFAVKKGAQYYFVLDGSDHGLPYGSWRGGSGIQIKRKSGKPFLQFYDAAPRRDIDFIYSEGGKFWSGCNQFSYVGVNTWDLMDIARYPHRRHEVDERLDEMKQGGLTVGRIWGFSLGTGVTEEERENRLQLTPGVYDEAVFKGLDYALAAAAERGIRLIVSIEDFWLSVGAYEDWSETMKSTTDFYTDWIARNFYKDHIKALVHRKNTFTNVTYIKDPTIFAWNLMNEPRCTGCGWALQAWIDEMALYMKAIDPNHMVTIGEEGFYSTTCHRVHINPGAGARRSGLGSSPWALQEGQDFINNHKPKSIDFATVHIWMDNWMGYADYCGFINQNKRFDYTFGCDVWKEKLESTKLWLAAHIQDVKQLNKPLVVQEFGKTIDASKLHDELEGALLPGESAHGGLDIRNQFFEAVYQEIEKDALAGGSTLGSNFWNLYREGHGEDDPYHVTLGHTSTMDVVNAHVFNMKQVTTAAKC